MEIAIPKTSAVIKALLRADYTTLLAQSPGKYHGAYCAKLILSD